MDSGSQPLAVEITRVNIYYLSRKTAEGDFSHHSREICCLRLHDDVLGTLEDAGNKLDVPLLASRLSLQSGRLSEEASDRLLIQTRNSPAEYLLPLFRGATSSTNARVDRGLP